MKVLVLYSEIAGYFVSCVRCFAELYGAEVHVVRWPINPEAPFKFSDHPGIIYHERKDFDTAGLLKLAHSINPDALYISGWIDKPYLKVARSFFKLGKPVIAAFDTQWRGDFRQRLATWLSPFLFRRQFTHAWVPGMFQYEYARRLGFPREKILTGMYSADTALFEAVYGPATVAKAVDYPHRILYVGRYLDYKGVLELYHAFKELSEEQSHDWELLLVGNGPLKDELKETQNIKFQDFVQPDALPQLAMGAGAFVLPSRRDAWGVVLHEFAAAGLPLISTDAAGAITAFVKEGYNGFVHRRNDKDSLKAVLKDLIACSDDELRKMGSRSHELSKQISPNTWAATLYHITEGKG
jgi:glycosyltransferase involved in cell wall biosynthesis